MNHGRPVSRPPVAPALGIAALPVAYVLSLYLDQGVWIAAGLRAATITAALALAIVGLASLILRDRERGALVGACAIAAIVVWVPALALLFLLLGLAIVIDAVFAGRTRRRQARDVALIYRGLGVFGLALLTVTLAQFGLRGQVLLPAMPAPIGAAQDAARPPDIWVVLVDGYPRADILERDWGFDNSAFVEALSDLGFFVADRARSNYNATKLTLPSMFNMALLGDLEPYADYAKPADAPAADRVRALLVNRAFEVLRDRGYATVAIGSGYTHEEIRTADTFIDAGTADVVELHVLGRSALGKLMFALAPDFAEAQIRARIEANLAAMDRLADVPGSPRFVWVHVPSPHPPFAFSDAGDRFLSYDRVFEYPVETLGDDGMRVAYRQHIARLNRLLMESLTGLVDGVGRESILIVMSDHGSRVQDHVERLTPESVAEQFASFFAVRTPDGALPFDDDIMTANVLATLFNHYLGTEFPMAPSVIESLDGTRYDDAGYPVADS